MNNRSYFFFYIFLLFTIHFQAQPAAPSLTDAPATEEHTAPKLSIFNTMQYSELLTINLTTDVNLLIEQKKKDEYQPASINFKTAEGGQIQQQVKIKARGKSRRRICDFPPIKIKFKKEELASLGLNREFNEYKLVTHCSDGKDAEYNILKEFLAYKIYNELTDASFRVQLVKINYLDTESAKITFVKYGFLLEDNEELCDRLEGEMIKAYNVQPTVLDPNEYNLLTFFQYMIGNTDWDLSVMHNIKILNCAAKESPMLVPYDFDFAGIVNTNYALPKSTLPQIDVRDRVYMGPCLEDEELARLIQIVQAKKPNILALIKDFDFLPKKHRRDIQKYLNDFFVTLNDPSALREALHWNCPVAE